MMRQILVNQIMYNEIEFNKMYLKLFVYPFVLSKCWFFKNLLYGRYYSSTFFINFCDIAQSDFVETHNLFKNCVFILEKCKCKNVTLVK